VRGYSGPNCSALSSTKTITFLTAPAVPVISPGSSTTLSASNPAVTLTSSSASSYSWSTGATTRAVSINSQGSYRVTVTGTNGCKATSSDIAIRANGCTPPPVPVITASASTIITSGQTVTLTSSLAGGYLWSNGSTARSITVSAGGIYTVRAYNAGGCYTTSLPAPVTVLQARAKNSENVTENSESKVSVYPNPVKDDLNVVFNASENKSYNIRLIDITGRTIKEQTLESVAGENKIQFDVTTLPGGIYFAWIISDGKKETVKVIVDRQ